MSNQTRVWLLLSTITLALGVCRAAPTTIVLEIPDNFTGPVVLRENADSAIGWRTHGEMLLLEVRGTITEVRSLEPVEGKYLKYQARLKTGTSIPFIPMIAAKTYEGIGLFGGSTTSQGELHFYIGEAKDAIAYFDRLVGKKSQQKGQVRVALI